MQRESLFLITKNSPIQQVLILSEELDIISNCPVIKCWHYNEAAFFHDYIIRSVTEDFSPTTHLMMFSLLKSNMVYW